MNETTFDAVSRRAGTVVSRRGSLLTLGGAALVAVMATPGSTLAGKKNRKKNRKKAKKQAFKLCKKQVGECQTFMNAACNGAGCGEVVAVCCPLLGTCQNEAFFTCIVEATTGPAPEAIGSSSR